MLCEQRQCCWSPRRTPPAPAGAPGRIVNIGSQAGTISLPLMSPYSCSKFALEALSDSLRYELAPQGIKVGEEEAPQGARAEVGVECARGAAPGPAGCSGSLVWRCSQRSK